MARRTGRLAGHGSPNSGSSGCGPRSRLRRRKPPPSRPLAEYAPASGGTSSRSVGEACAMRVTELRESVWTTDNRPVRRSVSQSPRVAVWRQATGAWYDADAAGTPSDGCRQITGRAISRKLTGGSSLARFAKYSASKLPGHRTNHAANSPAAGMTGECSRVDASRACALAASRLTLLRKAGVGAKVDRLIEVREVFTRPSAATVELVVRLGCSADAATARRRFPPAPEQAFTLHERRDSRAHVEGDERASDHE